MAIRKGRGKFFDGLPVRVVFEEAGVFLQQLRAGVYFRITHLINPDPAADNRRNRSSLRRILGADGSNCRRTSSSSVVMLTPTCSLSPKAFNKSRSCRMRWLLV